MKYCPKCTTTKTREEFHKANGHGDGLQPYCKQCKKAIDAAIYARGGEEYKRWKAERQRVIATRNAYLLYQYLLEHPCVDCGESDPLVLEFDHVFGEKRYNIGDLPSRYSSWETILAEIAKCEVRCANCHRRITAKRAGKRRRYLQWLEAHGMG